MNFGLISLFEISQKNRQAIAGLNNAETMSTMTTVYISIKCCVLCYSTSVVSPTRIDTPHSGGGFGAAPDYKFFSAYTRLGYGKIITGDKLNYLSIQRYSH